ncbi:MAG: type VI secretion system-associated FHA domain protein TagH [Ectothiorhodospiraceae bacterium]|nr:type VI secretion system-associated FHA domain protein TagH [Ectothiorhodospiraceae bacterium]MCH8503524.1 type VI secretion system-associated FHA domain protein TagH [Ectothiorhodospiraceae bacterium]
MPLTLTVINEASSRLGGEARHRWHDKGGTVGRADNNDWTLPDPHMEISRCHARIRFQQGRYYLEDTSANGILLADGVTRVEPAEPFPLEDGTEFQIGDYRIRASVTAQECTTPSETLPHRDPPTADSDDPLALLGGAVEQSPGPPEEQSASESYLNEHFSAPRFLDAADTEPDQPARPEPRPESPPERPLLPDNWWEEPVGTPPSTEAADPEVTPQPDESPPPVQAEQPAPEETHRQPVRPKPGGWRADNDAAVAEPGLPDQALRQLLAGAGLDPDQVPADKAEELGRILRVAIRGVMDLLQARMEVKNEFRMSVTLIQARENNPLKFSTSPEDALHNLMVKHNPDYLEPVEAFEAGFQDLRHHQLAMLAGMRSGFFEMLRQFDPEFLEKRFGNGGERSMLGRVTGPRQWDQYKALFADIQRDTEGYFNRLFGEAFVYAYEKQIEELKTRSR